MDVQLIQKLNALLPEKVFTPRDEVYKKASTMFTGTTSPVAVVRPDSSEEVAEVIRFATKHNVPLAVRSGGHNNVASRLTSDRLLVDMSGLASIEVVNPREFLVSVEAGALWHQVAEKLNGYGLAISSGDTRTVGAGGLSTGGGLGWMIRKYGPLVDTMVSAEIVTADGKVREVSTTQHPDLFWAIRGGGGNFGIATRFTFKAHPVKQVTTCFIMYPLQEAANLLTGWRDAMRKAPAELTTMFLTFPPMGEGPAGVAITGCFEGDDEVARQAYEPFLKLGVPIHQEITVKPYKDVLEDGHPPAGRGIVHNAYMKELSDDAIAAIDRLCQGTPPILQIRHVAGAMNNRPADSTAFSHRDSEVLVVNPTFVSPDASPEEIEAALAPWRAIEPFGNGVYLNLLSEDTGKEIFQAYPPETLERLRTIKSTYDPDNIFNTTYAIPPAES